MWVVHRKCVQVLVSTVCIFVPGSVVRVPRSARITVDTLFSFDLYLVRISALSISLYSLISDEFSLT